MEEQVYAKKQQGSRRPMLLAVVIIVLAAIVGYFIIANGKPNDPAKYIPKEVAVAATVDLTRSADKDAALDMIHKVFKDGGINNPEQELFKALKKELKLDFDKDVVSHLSGTGAAAVLTEMSGLTPTTVAVVNTKSDGDADALIKTLGDKLNKDKVGFKRLSYKKYYYYSIPVGTPDPSNPFGPMQFTNYIGAVDSAIVWSNGDSGIKKVIDTVKGQPSLVKEPNFIKLRKTSSSTFAVVYFSGEGYYKMISPMLNMSMSMVGGVPPELKEQIENTVAAVGIADANGEGIKLRGQGFAKKATMKLENLKLDEMANTIPKDAKIAFAMKSWDKVWVEFKKAMFENPNMKPQIDQSITQAKKIMGFDPLKDLLDHFTSFSIYYVPGKADNPDGFPGSITFVLTADKPAVVKSSIDKLHMFAAMTGQMQPSKARIAGQDVVIIPMGEDGVKLGDTIFGDKVIVSICGSNPSPSIANAINTIKSKSDTLASVPNYRLVKKYLPESGQGLAYGDIGGIVDAFKDQIPPADRKKVTAVFKHVGLYGATGETKGTESTSTFVVPFKK